MTTKCDKLEKVNKRALHFVLKDKSSSFMEVLKKLGTVSLYDQRIMKIASCVFKGAVSRNSAKLGNYKMPVKVRET